MACDCLKVVTERLRAHVVAGLEAGIEIESARFEHEKYLLEEGRTAIALPFTVHYTRLTKARKVQAKQEHVSIQPPFCPFCGKAFKDIDDGQS